MKFTKEDARRRVLNCAKQYQQKLLNKKLIIIYRERNDNMIRYIEVAFHERNYQHLTGIELVDSGGNFCLGLTKEGSEYVPSSALLEDIKTLTNAPSQVLAIFEKNSDNKMYETLKHVAKGVNLNNLKLPDEINSLIDLKNYIYKGK